MVLGHLKTVDYLSPPAFFLIELNGTLLLTIILSFRQGAKLR